MKRFYLIVYPQVDWHDQRNRGLHIYFGLKKTSTTYQSTNKHLLSISYVPGIVMWPIWQDLKKKKQSPLHHNDASQQGNPWNTYQYIMALRSLPFSFCSGGGITAEKVQNHTIFVLSVSTDTLINNYFFLTCKILSSDPPQVHILWCMK